ncbi:uncharacterized protein LOC120008799 [Tripterygium wilfordii]|uniref:uncharacterized protein LOC120008799 n=1 Tax=Tripterygium wilfordii TaxID=458696 RepID=UPI0018F7F497|nr:uncharacterized protein LOC120008799 [Tripterygium wilfordii]
MVDHSTSLNGERVKGLLEEFGNQLVNSTPYYAQSNGQAKSSNKALKNIRRKMVEQNAKQWHETLAQALWAHRMSPRSVTSGYTFSIGVRGFMGTQNESSFRSSVARGNKCSINASSFTELSKDDYTKAMMQNLLELDEVRLDALNRIEVQRLK